MSKRIIKGIPIIRMGTKVRTNKVLGETKGMLVKPKHLKARRPNSIGIVDGYIPDHGGDCWWIRHGDAPDGSEIGAYYFDEFEPIQKEKNNMPKFRKKPVVIEAEQWFPGVEIEGVTEHKTPTCIYGKIQTPEGTMTVSESDWVITGVKGEKYPVKPDIFEATYEPIREGRKNDDEYQRREAQCLYEELKYVYPELAVPDERTSEEKKRDAEQAKIDLFGEEN